MLKKNIVELLNLQINQEQYSSNLYLQMGAWCDNHGYTGCGKFLCEHADEEHMHMMKLFNYLSETGNLPVLGTIDAPPIEWGDLKILFEKILDHERKITQSINNLVAKTFAEQDFSTFNFLQWYVSEQHEEEHLFQSILDKLNIIGVEGKGIYFFDKEIGKLAKK